MRNLFHHLPQSFLMLFLWVFSESGVVRNGSAESPVSFHVGVVLDLKSNVGVMAESCISIALSDFYDIYTNYTTRLVLHTMDSRGDAVDAASAVLYLMEDVEVQAIIGPQESTQASFVIDLGEKAQVPILSFSATSPSLSPSKNPYFVRTAIDDSIQAKAITAIIQAFEWKEVVLIYEDTNYGNRLVLYFIDALQEIYVRVPYRSIIPLDANDDEISKELHRLKTMQTTVFIVHMSSSIGSRLFINADNAGMMSQGYAWIVTDGLSSSFAHMDSNAINSMEGVLGVRPYIPKSKELEELKVKWKRSFYSIQSYGEMSDLNLHGIWAYDTVWALAMAVEQVGTLDPQFLSSNNTNKLTDLSSLGYSPIGPRLLQTILSTRFKGLSGDFHLIKGQLKCSAFQIFNVFGEGQKVIGYWTPTDGISRQLHTNNKTTNSASMSKLKVVVWPGDSTTKPNWVNKKPLKVLVPKKAGFKQFVNAEQGNNITGFCIEVFNMVTNIIGLSYEYQPYPQHGDVLKRYNELIEQVYHKNYDAAVGDISILLNRSRYVDFTIPFTHSGVQMVVPKKEDLQKEIWMFVKPLSPALWLVSLGGFFFIGFVVWILEHPQNSSFGPTFVEGIQTSLWYSLTLIFAQREGIHNNLTRFVLVTWVFFVLILTQSYTANLSSMLTARQLQPTITDVNVLKEKGYYVGYQDRSFVKDLLMQHFRFDESKLKNYTTTEEYHDALSKGTNNGGVAAIFDEIPYVQVFLNKYCDKYTTVGLTYSSEGFGFVFPKGSPLVSKISMAILTITDNGTLDDIKKKWLLNQTICNNTDASSTLTLRSFGGLFIIIGGVSGFSLSVHLFWFAYKRYSAGISWSQMLHWFRNALNLMHLVSEGRPTELVEDRRYARHGEEDIVEERLLNPSRRTSRGFRRTVSFPT